MQTAAKDHSRVPRTPLTYLHQGHVSSLSFMHNMHQNALHKSK